MRHGKPLQARRRDLRRASLPSPVDTRALGVGDAAGQTPPSCKHVAAAPGSTGKPELLFVLRGVDESELLSAFGQDAALNTIAPVSANVLDDNDVRRCFDWSSPRPTLPITRPLAKGTSTRSKRSAAAAARLPRPACNPHPRTGKKSAKVKARVVDPGELPPFTKRRCRTAQTAAGL
jgi:hypothetical protein